MYYPLESLGTGKGANAYLFILLNEGNIAMLQYQVASGYSSIRLPETLGRSTDFLFKYSDSLLNTYPDRSIFWAVS